MNQHAAITLVVEPITMRSLSAGIEKRQKDVAKDLSLKSAVIIVSDPLYRLFCPVDSIFYELPHVAFSGRIYF